MFIIIIHLLVEHLLHELPHHLPVHVALIPPEAVQDCQGRVKIPSEVIAHGQPGPGGALGLQFANLLPGLLQTIEVSHLDLEDRKIPPTVKVFSINLQSISEALDGLLVLPL